MRSLRRSSPSPSPSLSCLPQPAPLPCRPNSLYSSSCCVHLLPDPHFRQMVPLRHLLLILRSLLGLPSLPRRPPQRSHLRRVQVSGRHAALPVRSFSLLFPPSSFRSRRIADTFGRVGSAGFGFEQGAHFAFRVVVSSSYLATRLSSCFLVVTISCPCRTSTA
jgi:hypothetical protein